LHARWCMPDGAHARWCQVLQCDKGVDTSPPWHDRCGWNLRARFII
jgi:hypothetical protein